MHFRLEQRNSSSQAWPCLGPTPFPSGSSAPARQNPISLDPRAQSRRSWRSDRQDPVECSGSSAPATTLLFGGPVAPEVPEEPSPEGLAPESVPGAEEPELGAEKPGPGDGEPGPEESGAGDGAPDDRAMRPVSRPAERRARPACALAAGACFSAVRAAAWAAMLACWAAALVRCPSQRAAISEVDADSGPSPAGSPAGASATGPPTARPSGCLGTRTGTSVRVRVAKRKSPTAPNSTMMMPEASGLSWGSTGARAKRAQTTQAMRTWSRRGTTRTRPRGPWAVTASRAKATVPPTSSCPWSTCSDRSANATAASSSASCSTQKGTTRRPSRSPGSVGAA